jgi:hypothetical protein
MQVYSRFAGLAALVLALCATAAARAAASDPALAVRDEWPRTDFSRHAVPLAEIHSGGPGKDGIPAIDRPRFVPVAQYRDGDPAEPVIGLVVEQEARAYPLRVLLWHEIVNDEIGGVPVAVTYCPLCNTSIVFDRRVAGRVLDFGTTGMLRHSDLVMYDRQTQSWWQQYGGQAIVGALTGQVLTVLPSRLESLAGFRERAPHGRVLVPSDPGARDYGANPYVGYDRAATPFLMRGGLPKGIEPMMRVVAVGKTAWTLPLVRAKGVIEQGGLTLRWTAGQRSALDDARVERGRDVGGVTVTRAGHDVPYVMTFAFAFFAFHRDGVVYTETGPLRQAP